jgi:hypothetical protein
MRLVFLGVVAIAALTAVIWFWWPATQQEPPTPAEWFADITDQVGLRFIHDPGGPLNDYFVPRIIGSGAALFDFNKDGRLDILLLQNAGPDSGSTNRLYQQFPDGTFKDVSAGSGLDIAGYNMGVAIGDINNDGWPDVLITQYLGVKLFLNNGKGAFRDITAEAGLSNPAWGASAAFFDFDRDGWLDVIIVNYLDYDPTFPCAAPDGSPDYCNQAFPGTISRLFRNLGAAGVPRFKDVSLSSGVGRKPGPGLGVVCADFNGDGWPDIFVANDGRANHLWINQKNGTFKEEAILRGLAYNGMGVPEAGMGIAIGDVDGDGLWDVVVSHIATETHTFWKQGPRGLFQDKTPQVGLGRPEWQGTGWGLALVDFDLDGRLDLALVNGDVVRRDRPTAPALGPHWGWYAQRNQLFVNAGKGFLKDISAGNKAFCGHFNVARGLAWGDIDGDGAVDLLVSSIGGRARLFRNVAPRQGHWLMVRTLLPSPLEPGNPERDRDALGAEIHVYADGLHLWRLVNPADSYLSSSQPWAHFGLGSTTRIDHLEVLWPDNTLERFSGGEVDRIMAVRKGAGRTITAKSASSEAK